MVHIGFDKRAFLSFLFVFAFVGLIFGGVTAVQRFPQFRSRASIEYKPQAIEVVNITDTSVTLYWLTEEPTVGFVSFGETAELGKTRLDDRDIISGETKKYRGHIVTLSKLKPKTKYYYSLGVDGNNFDRDGYPYAFFTYTAPRGTANEKQLPGKLYVRNRTPAANYFVTLTFEKATGELSNTLGSLTERNGDFTIDLAKMRSANGTEIFSVPANASVTVDVIMRDELGEVASQSFEYSIANPLPALFFSSTREANAEPRGLPGLLDIERSTSPQSSITPQSSTRINLRTFDLLGSPTPVASPSTTPKPTPTLRPSLKLLL